MNIVKLNNGKVELRKVNGSLIRTIQSSGAINANINGELGRCDALLIGGDEINDVECLDQVKLHHMEKRVGRGRFGIVATVKLPRALGRPLAKVSVTALLAPATISPFELH